MSGERVVWCVIAAKDFARAKSRLAPVLDDAARADIARRMFELVLRVCVEQAGVTATLVATDHADVEAIALAAGAHVLRDTGDHDGLNRVIDRALAHAAVEGATHVIVLMADLPTLSRDELRTVIAALDDADVVIAPDRQRLGTNVLALALEGRQPTCFGREDSFEAHQQVARDNARRVSIVERLGLAFDVDTPADYASLAHPSARVLRS